MTALAIDWAGPRSALKAEMFTAYSDAISCGPDTPERHYFRGVGDGYAIGFGIAEGDRLTEAHTDLRAYPIPNSDPYLVEKLVDLTEKHPDWEAVAYRCGLLWGWSLVTSERDGIADCATCERRIVLDDNDHTGCAHGDFCCREHYTTFHGKNYCYSVGE